LANEATNNTLEFLKATAIGILLTPKTGFDFGENLHKTHEKANLDDFLGDRQSRDQKRGEIAGNIAPIAAGGTIGGILKKGKNAHKVGEAGRAAEGAGTTKLPAAVGETAGAVTVKAPTAISGKVDLQQGPTFTKTGISTKQKKQVSIEDKNIAAKDKAILKQIDKDIADNIILSDKQLQKKIKHASSFNLSTKYTKENITNFKIAIIKHINSSSTTKIEGTYRGHTATHYLDKNSKLNVIINDKGEFWSAWKLNDKQLKNILERGSL